MARAYNIISNANPRSLRIFAHERHINSASSVGLILAQFYPNTVWLRKTTRRLLAGLRKVQSFASSIYINN